MVNCLICNKKLGMITASHMKKFHKITCKDYANKFNLKKGEVNPHHSKKMTGEGNPRYGIVMPKELRNKIRRIHKTSGRFKGEGNPMFGKTHTPAVRKRLSASLKIAMKGEKNSFYGKKHTEETKEKISRIKKEFFKKHPEKHINSIIAKNYKNQKNKKGGYTSEGQLNLYKLIKKKLFKDAIINHPIQTEESLFFADIAIPSIKLNIEYDGKYWHLDELKDDKRDVQIIRKGWQVVRVKEEKVKNYSEEKLTNHIIKLIEENKFQVLK